MRKTIDELKKEYIGQTFNWLTVLDVYRNDKNIIMFTCKCICGKIKDIQKKSVLNNLTKSCGCVRTETIENLNNKYLNKTYNNLTISNIFRDDKNNIIFTCKCICGNIKNIPKNEVIYNRYKSCGCLQYDDNSKYINKKFNHLLILDFYSKQNTSRSIIYFKCKCDCGKVIDIQKSRIINNKTKSCGCYNHSAEFTKEVCNIKQKLRKQRDYNKLIEIIHPSYLPLIMDGKLTSNSVIETKCPQCNNYDKHILSNVFIVSKNIFKLSTPPLCTICRHNLTSSSYEEEIITYISTFYDGELIKNDRNILNGKELDIYIPEKKIAIEFNGDYWHSSEHKDKNYHINKYLNCKNNDIILVSIFESEWNKNKDTIKEYLKDLFNDKENILSFNKDKTLMNNNYPAPKIKIDSSLIIEESYVYNKYKVYTCGYSKIN